MTQPETRRRRVVVQVTPREDQQIRDAAWMRRLSASSWARQVLLDAAAEVAATARDTTQAA